MFLNTVSFPYRRYVLCPKCVNKFCGSVSKGKTGKGFFPTYHCNGRSAHKYLWIQKKGVEETLVSLRSFQSLPYAKLWFNGYILKRRFTKFTDCKGKFRSLNGKRGVDMTKNLLLDLPTFF